MPALCKHRNPFNIPTACRTNTTSIYFLRYLATLFHIHNFCGIGFRIDKLNCPSTYTNSVTRLHNILQAVNEFLKKAQEQNYKNNFVAAAESKPGI
jgi:hypothetical protein